MQVWSREIAKELATQIIKFKYYFYDDFGNKFIYRENRINIWYYADRVATNGTKSFSIFCDEIEDYLLANGIKTESEFGGCVFEQIINKFKKENSYTQMFQDAITKTPNLELEMTHNFYFIGAIYNPTETRDASGAITTPPSEEIVPLETVIASSSSAANVLLSRKIPENFLENLHEVTMVIKQVG